MTQTTAGKVYLVGSGPGDPGLITVKGRSLLERAEVVIYDYLANRKFLQYVPQGAEFIYVGKKGGGVHAHTQEEINGMLVAKAREGKRVVRLKGGDPFIFGRGGEEIERLVEEKIAFEVVPGVTAATAAATYAGIPITHRRFTATVAFVTGHEDPTKKTSNIAWDKLATGVGTLVFYMGIKNLPTIAERLMRHGRDPETPVAVIRWASTPEHRTVTGTLATIAEVVAAAGIRPPAVIVVGEVVNLREIMNWYEHKPLLGKRIMVTRTRSQASDLVCRLEELGADCIEFATISLRPPDSWEALDRAMAEIASFDWLLFTSINAISFFFGRLHDLGMDARNLIGVKIAAVGSATAEALRQHGLRADLLPDGEFTGKGLARTLIDCGHGGERFLLPRALKAAETLPKMLTNAGGEVVIAPVYQNVRPEGREEDLRAMLEEGKVDMVTFTSSSTFTNFMFMLNAGDHEDAATLLDGVGIASIGPITSRTIEEAGIKVDVQPERYTIADLVAAITSYYS